MKPLFRTGAGSAVRCILALLLIALVPTAPVYGQSAHAPPDITDAEWSLLPEYCPYTQTSPLRSDKVRVEQWYKLLGQNFHSMHHYCWGLIYHMRAERDRFRISRQVYAFMLRKAIGEMQFTIERIDPWFRLRPEFLTRQGRVYILAGRPQEAAKVFALALEQLPTYWPAAVGLGEAYLAGGRADLALAAVDAGLVQSPGVRQLTELRERLVKAAPAAARSAQGSGAPAVAGQRPATPSAVPVPAEPAPSASPVEPASDAARQQGKDETKQ